MGKKELSHCFRVKRPTSEYFKIRDYKIFLMRTISSLKSFLFCFKSKREKKKRSLLVILTIAKKTRYMSYTTRNDRETDRQTRLRESDWIENKYLWSEGWKKRVGKSVSHFSICHEKEKERVVCVCVCLRGVLKCVCLCVCVCWLELSDKVTRAFS